MQRPMRSTGEWVGDQTSLINVGHVVWDVFANNTTLIV